VQVKAGVATLSVNVLSDGAPLLAPAAPLEELELSMVVPVIESQLWAGSILDSNLLAAHEQQHTTSDPTPGRFVPGCGFCDGSPLFTARKLFSIVSSNATKSANLDSSSIPDGPFSSA
jgi:hypothetical protein